MEKGNHYDGMLSRYGDDIQRRIDCDYDDIGYEAGRIYDQKTGEALSFSHLDMEILTKWDQIHNQKHLVQDHLEAGREMAYFTEDKKKIYNLDSALVWHLSQIAFNMYRFYGQDEHMKEAMDQLIHNRQEEKELAREFEISELNSWWDNS